MTRGVFGGGESLIASVDVPSSSDATIVTAEDECRLSRWLGGGENTARSAVPSLSLRSMRIFPILIPLQHARSAFSIASPDRMMDTPHIFLLNVTPL